MAFVANWRSHEVTRIHILLFSFEQGITIRSCIFAIDLNARKVNTTRCHVNWFKKYLKVWKNRIRLNKSLGLKLRSKKFILYPLMRSFYIYSKYYICSKYFHHTISRKLVELGSASSWWWVTCVFLAAGGCA